MEDLIMAALSGNDARIHDLLAAGTDPDVADGNGWTALGSSAARGHGAIVDRLLVAGADVNRADIKGNSALMRAAAGGHVGIAGRLLEAKASIDHADARGRTALMQAIDNRRVEMVALLLTAGSTRKDAADECCIGWRRADRGYVVERRCQCAQGRCKWLDGAYLLGSRRRLRRQEVDRCEP